MTIEIGRMFSGAGYPGFGQHLPEHHKLLPPSFPEPKGDQIDPLQNQLCRVCEEPAAGFHFGAFTCEGCKSFFGRTCNNQSVIQECKNNYRCVVDKKNRTACKACRLRKCLMVGMSKSGSRYGRRSNWFKIHCLMQQNLGKGGGSNPSAPPSIIPPPVTSMSHHSSPFGSSLPPTISWPPPHHPAAHHQLPLSSMLSGSSPLSSAHSPLTALASPLSSSHSPLSSPMKKEKSDCSSRSPSPLNVSTLSSPDGSLKSSPREIEKPAPRKLGDLSGLSPPSAGAGLPPPPTSLHNLYFPPPLPFLASNPFSFYRLSPLLATNPFLANSLYFSLASAAGQKSPPNDDSLTAPIIPPVSTADSTVPGSVMEYQKSFQEHLRYLEMLKEKEFGPSKPDGRTSPYLNVDQVKEELSPPSSPDLKSSADDSRAVSPPSLPLTNQLHKENLQILTESPASRRHFESATTADQQKLTVRHLELLREHQTLLKAYSGLPTRDILPTGEGGLAMDLSVAVKEKSD